MQFTFLPDKLIMPFSYSGKVKKYFTFTAWMAFVDLAKRALIHMLSGILD